MNSVKGFNVKNRKYYFFDDMIIIENLDSNKIKIDEKSYRNILTNSVKHFYLTINKIVRYVKESNGNKYFTLLPSY